MKLITTNRARRRCYLGVPAVPDALTVVVAAIAPPTESVPVVAAETDPTLTTQLDAWLATIDTLEAAC